MRSGKRSRSEDPVPTSHFLVIFDICFQNNAKIIIFALILTIFVGITEISLKFPQAKKTIRIGHSQGLLLWHGMIHPKDCISQRTEA